MPIPLTLKVYRGDELIRTEHYNRDIIKIGRLSSAHLCLDDEKVSRIHSVIEIGGDGNLSIIDMGSAEGTYVNGKRVNKGPIQVGDELTVGGLRITIEAGDADAAASADATRVVSEASVAAAQQEEIPDHSNPDDAHDEATAAGHHQEPEPEPEPVRRAAPKPAAAAPRRAAAPARVERDDDDDHRGGDYGVELRLVWGTTLIDAATFVKPPKPVKVGTTEGCDFVLSGTQLPGDEHSIIRYDGDYKFIFGKGMDGEHTERGQTVALRDMVSGRQAQSDSDGYAVNVPHDGMVWVDFGGGVRMEARYKKPPKPAVVPWWERLNYQFLNLFLILFFIEAGFMVAAANFPYDTDTIADDLFKNPARMAKFVLKPPEQQKKNPYLERLERSLKKDPGEMAAKHKGTEGQMGKRDAPKTTGRSAPKAIDPNDKEIVKNTGILKLLGRGGGGLSTIFGQGGLGGDLKGAIGNMFGPVVGDSRGLGGLGLKGSGSGGGGVGDTIGIGAVGTKGRGGGLGGYGTGVGGLGKKGDRDVSIATGTPIVQGSLDKELIRKVIQSHASQIRYCYEQQLAISPKLEGKVSIRWIINANGSVSSPQLDRGGTTMDNGAVPSCMMSRIGTWMFPKPKGGGIVVVTYPWILRPSGGGG
jgi:hypothetical protein